jgi:hypothetical protein
MGSGFRTFQSGEVLTSSNVQNFLMDQAVMVFAGTAARGSAIASPETGMLTYRTDGTADSGREGFEFYNGSAYTRLIQQAGILQVVSTTKTDTFTSSSTSFTDITGLSVSITPSATSSKVFILANVITTVDLDRGVFLQLVRDSTAIGLGDTAGNRVRVTSFWTTGATDAGFPNVPGLQSMMFLDSPNTTSATTYKVQGLINAAGSFYVNRFGSDVDSSTRGRSISTITAFEVSA